MPDFRHRAIRHHSEGIFECMKVFGTTIKISAGKQHTAETCPGRPCSTECDHFSPKLIPVRWIGEQHVQEDLGRIPTPADWLRRITAEPWMNASRKLSRELEREERTPLDVLEADRAAERLRSRARPDYDPRIDHPERYTDGPI